MTTKKLTKRDHFNALLELDAVKGNEQLTEFINHELELLDRKNQSKGEKKLTPQQMANIAIGENVVEYLRDIADKRTITAIIKEMGLEDVSNQRLTHIMSDLIANNLVEKIVEKRVSYFKVVEA